MNHLDWYSRTCHNDPFEINLIGAQYGSCDIKNLVEIPKIISVDYNLTVWQMFFSNEMLTANLKDPKFS